MHIWLVEHGGRALIGFATKDSAWNRALSIASWTEPEIALTIPRIAHFNLHSLIRIVCHIPFYFTTQFPVAMPLDRTSKPSPRQLLYKATINNTTLHEVEKRPSVLHKLRKWNGECDVNTRSEQESYNPNNIGFGFALDVVLYEPRLFHHRVFYYLFVFSLR